MDKMGWVSKLLVDLLFGQLMFLYVLDQYYRFRQKMFIFQLKVCFICKVLVTKIDNNGAIVWSTKIGDAHKTPNMKSYSIGFAIDQVHNIRLIEPFYDGKDIKSMYNCFLGCWIFVRWHWSLEEKFQSSETCCGSIRCKHWQCGLDQNAKFSTQTWWGQRAYC